MAIMVFEISETKRFSLSFNIWSTLRIWNNLNEKVDDGSYGNDDDDERNSGLCHETRHCDLMGIVVSSGGNEAFGTKSSEEGDGECYGNDDGTLG